MQWLTKGISWIASKWSGMGAVGKGLALGGGALVATDVAVEGGASEGFLTKVMKMFGFASAEANADSMFEGLYQKFENLIKLIQLFTGPGPITNSLIDVARKGQGLPPAIRDAEGKIIGEEADPNKPDFLKKDSERAVGERVAEADIAMNNSGETLGMVAAGGTLAAAKTIPAVGAAVGVRAVPILGAVFAGASGIYDVAGYAMEGNFKKAGVRLLSGTFDTVASAFGAPGMVVAAAGRELIETGGEAVLGSDAALPDAPTVGLAKDVGNWVYKGLNGGPS